MQGQALTVKNPDGSAELYGFVADVTERKALEADLRRAREDAEAADRAKSAFLAMMSHELRTPLVAVTGTLEILALDALDERQRELVDVAMGSARALLAVIGDVLDFSKIEAGFLDLAPVTVAVGPLVDEVAGQHRHAARLRGLELTVDAGPGAGRRARGRRRAAAPGARQPAGQRHEVHARGRRGGRRHGARRGRRRPHAARRAGRLGHRHRHRRRRTSGACSSRSPRPAPTTPAAARARGWAWRSAASWSRRWAGRSRCAARRGRGRR